jgi:hypothetical protein
MSDKFEPNEDFAMTSSKSIPRKQNCTVAFILASLLFTSAAIAQAQDRASTTVVPTLVNFSGTLSDSAGKPLTGTVGVTFLLYRDEQGGAPLWVETQNVQPDSRGHYSARLGSTSSQGLPKDVFASGEARWLAVQVQGESERPRVLLLSVPYALKAADAETIGGLPPSAFVLAGPVGNAAANVNGANGSAAASAPPPASSNVTTAGGTVNALPLFSTATDIENSVVTQTGSGATGRIGIGTTTPASTLDVKGNATIRGPESVLGALTLPSSGAATATAGKISQPLAMAASSFSSTSSAAVNQIFQWQAEPAANDTAAPSGTLNLLFGSGTAKPAETGFNIAASGRITFAPGQVFPGVGTLTGVTTASGSGLVGGGTSGSLSLGLLNTCTKNQTLQWSGTAWACATAGGSGTITGVTAGTDLTGGGTSGTVTLNLDTTKVPQLSGNNSFVGNQTMTGNLNVSGFGEFLAPHRQHFDRQSDFQFRHRFCVPQHIIHGRAPSGCDSGGERLHRQQPSGVWNRGHREQPARQRRYRNGLRTKRDRQWFLSGFWSLGRYRHLGRSSPVSDGGRPSGSACA